MNSRTARGSRTSVEDDLDLAHHVGRQVVEPAPGAKRGVQRHGANPVAVGDEAFDKVRSDEAVTPGDGDDVRHGFSDSRARGRIPRRLDGTQYAIRPRLSFPSMTPGDSSAERPPVAQTLVFIVPRLARGGMLSVMQAAWAQLHGSRIVVVTQEHSTTSVEHETVLLPRTFGDPLRFPGAWIYAWRVARAAAGIARAASGEVILVPQDALGSGAGAVLAGRRTRTPVVVMDHGSAIVYRTPFFWRERLSRSRLDERIREPFLRASLWILHRITLRGADRVLLPSPRRSIASWPTGSHANGSLGTTCRSTSIDSILPIPRRRQAVRRRLGAEGRRHARPVAGPPDSREGARPPRRFGRASPARSPPDPGNRRLRAAAGRHRGAIGGARDRRAHARRRPSRRAPRSHRRRGRVRLLVTAGHERAGRHPRGDGLRAPRRRHRPTSLGARAARRGTRHRRAGRRRRGVCRGARHGRGPWERRSAALRASPRGAGSRSSTGRSESGVELADAFSVR